MKKNSFFKIMVIAICILSLAFYSQDLVNKQSTELPDDVDNVLDRSINLDQFQQADTAEQQDGKVILKKKYTERFQK